MFQFQGFGARLLENVCFWVAGAAAPTWAIAGPALNKATTMVALSPAVFMIHPRPFRCTLSPASLPYL
jgi:hypothetical protein